MMKSHQMMTTLCSTAALAAVVATPAAIIETSIFTQGGPASGAEYTYDANASSSDLINEGSASLASFTASLPGTWPASGTNDGSATGGSPTGDYAYWDLWDKLDVSAITLTYELTGSATGYDITSINSIYGWYEGRRHAAQYYSVFVATVSNPTYTLLHTVAYDPTETPFNHVGSQVTLTDTTGVLASGVTGIRFVAIDDAAGLYNEVGVIHELDVFGTPTVPEPGSLALMPIGGMLIARRRRA